MLGAGICAVWVVAPGPAAIAQTRDDADAIAFFEAKIRPVLVERCYSCHSAKSDKIKGDFLLDTRAGIRKGGASNAANGETAGFGYS
jgi:uncharacterized membrane protein